MKEQKQRPWRKIRVGLLFALLVFALTYLLFRDHLQIADKEFLQRMEAAERLEERRENERYTRERFSEIAIQSWFQTIVYADRVETLRLAHGGDERESISAVGPVLTGEALGQAITLVSNSSNYDEHLRSMKPCAPRPGVILRFRRGSAGADVRICFECEIIELVGIPFRTQSMNFDRYRNRWMALALEAFPSDAALNAMNSEPPYVLPPHLRQPSN